MSSTISISEDVCVTSVARTVNPSAAPESTPGFKWLFKYQYSSVHLIYFF